MQITLLLFGRASEIAGTTKMIIRDIRDTYTLQNYLLKHYPALGSINYAIAVEEQIIKTNTILKEGVTVAILPAFSGG